MSLSRYETTIGELTVRKIYTPDLKDAIEPYSNHVFFIWDSFKLSFPSDKLLQDCPFLGRAWTVEKNFVMRVCPTMPILFQAQPSRMNTLNATGTWGEAYSLKTHDIIRMDAVMDNMGSFQRRKRYIALEDQDFPGNSNRKVTVQAWVYLATPEYQAMMSDLRTGTQTKHGKDTYWEWRHSDMRPTN